MRANTLQSDCYLADSASDDVTVRLVAEHYPMIRIHRNVCNLYGYSHEARP